MDVPASLTFFEFKILNLEFTGENVTYNDFIFALDKSGHGKLDEWEGVNAFFLFFKLFAEAVSEKLWS